MDESKLQTFDPTQSWSAVNRRLPHWEQAGTLCFITLRTVDSLPAEVIKRWSAERDALLQSAGLLATRGRVSPKLATQQLQLRTELAKLPPAIRYKLQWSLTQCFEQHLNRCYGACPLREESLRKIVRDSLPKFDGDRYELTDFVIMPNHVHILGTFPEEGAMFKQCSNWKRYTARQINKALDDDGGFWQVEGFDHLVRTMEYFERYREYIAENGPKAGLRSGEYLWYRKP